MADIIEVDHILHKHKGKVFDFIQQLVVGTPYDTVIITRHQNGYAFEAIEGQGYAFIFRPYTDFE